VRRFQTVRSLLKTAGSRESSSLPFRNGNEFSLIQIGDDFRFGCWRSYHSSLCHVPEAHGKSAYSRLYEGHSVNTHLLRSTMIAEFLPFMNEKRSATTQVKAPPQLQKTVCEVSHPHELFVRFGLVSNVTDINILLPMVLILSHW
jgi:large subunit ribosomal protein L45